MFAGWVVLAEIWSPAGLDVDAKKNFLLLPFRYVVNFGWNWILSTQRVGGGVVCIFFYTKSWKLTLDRIAFSLHKELVAGWLAFSSTQRVAS